jgi:hypothetical protein
LRDLIRSRLGLVLVLRVYANADLRHDGYTRGSRFTPVLGSIVPATMFLYTVFAVSVNSYTMIGIVCGVRAYQLDVSVLFCGCFVEEHVIFPCEACAFFTGDLSPIGDEGALAGELEYLLSRSILLPTRTH